MRIVTRKGQALCVLIPNIIFSRYFCGVASTPKQQRSIIESYWNEFLKKNQQIGREGRYPLTYKECHEVAREVLAAAQVITVF